jgi:hypothetical protein
METTPAPKFSQNFLESRKTIVLEPGDWLPSGAEGVNNSPERGVLCVEDLVKREKLKLPIRVLEIGPTPISVIEVNIENEKPAPISLINKRHPDWRCLAAGHHILEGELRDHILGEVEFLQGSIGIRNKSFYNQNLIPEIINKLGDHPQIIYGQHVFENSETGFNGTDPLPFGPYVIFDGAAELVASGGFIVVDNYGGKKYQIGRDLNDPNTKLTELVYEYKYCKVPLF